MIFTFNESMMNGVVAMNTETTGIEANTFEEAKYILQSKLDKIPEAEVFINMDDRFDYKIKNSLYEVYGHMENKPLRMISL